MAALTSQPVPRPGHAWRHRTRHALAGFTLLELLVVVSIVALATAGVSFALRDTSANLLERDAQQLGAMLTAAHAQARMQGLPTVLRVRPGGFELDGRYQAWQSPDTQATVETLPGTVIRQWTGVIQDGSTLVVSPEPVQAPASIRLNLRDRSLRLGTDGLRPWAVLP